MWSFFVRLLHQFTHMIRYVRGKVEVKWFPKKASAAMSANTFGAYSAAGLMTFATATSTEIAGLLLRTITSADDDYATANVMIPVLVGDENTVWEYDGDAHNATELMNGEFVDITSASVINGGASSLEVIKVEKYISATKLEFSIPKKSGVAASTNAD